MKKKKYIIFAAGVLILFSSLGFSVLKNKDLDLVKNLDIYYRSTTRIDFEKRIFMD